MGNEQSTNDQIPENLPTDPTAFAETGSTMDLPPVDEQPPVAAETTSLPVAETYVPYATAVPTRTETTSLPVAPDYPKAPILRGPSPWTVVHGLIALAVAVLVFVTTATTAQIDWGTAGPATVVGLGVVLVLLGLLGMRGRRRVDA